MTPARSEPLPWWEWVLVVLAAAYCLGPWRRFVWDMSAFSLAAVWVLWRGRPPRARGADWVVVSLGLWTVALAGLFGVASSSAYRPGLFTRWVWTCGFYVPFAAVQQVVTQRYMLERLAPQFSARPLAQAAFAGVVFGLCHLPLEGLVLPTLLSGVAWCLCYLLSGRLWPVVLSHAALGATYFVCVLGADPFR